MPRCIPTPKVRALRAMRRGHVSVRTMRSLPLGVKRGDLTAVQDEHRLYCAQTLRFTPKGETKPRVAALAPLATLVAKQCDVHPGIARDGAVDCTLCVDGTQLWTAVFVRCDVHVQPGVVRESKCWDMSGDNLRKGGSVLGHQGCIGSHDALPSNHG